MWHVSTAGADKAVLSMAAQTQLLGYGDPSLGQWTEWTGYAYHLRRRLSLAEQQQVGVAVDVRGTPEAEARVVRLLAAIPLGQRERLAQIAAEEIS